MVKLGTKAYAHYVNGVKTGNVTGKSMREVNEDHLKD